MANEFVQERLSLDLDTNRRGPKTPFSNVDESPHLHATGLTIESGSMNAVGRLAELLAVLLSVGSTLAVGAAVMGCHRATEQDCEEIVDKIVELELKEQGVTDPEVVATRKTETKTHKRDELISGCVGKRVSVTAMQCIREAHTSTEVTEKCLR